MKTLSIRQPWAWLVINGFKTVENRTWATKHRGPLLIHASKIMDFQGDLLAEFRCEIEKCGIFIPEKLETGGVVGIVEVIDCTKEPTGDDVDWHEPGCFAWVLRNARPVKFRPYRGRLGLFET